MGDEGLEEYPTELRPIWTSTHGAVAHGIVLYRDERDEHLYVLQAESAVDCGLAVCKKGELFSVRAAEVKLDSYMGQTVVVRMRGTVADITVCI